jgi:hypothetical protein
VSLNKENNCCEISEDKIAVCKKTQGLQSGNFSDLNSACSKVLLPVKIFQFHDMHYESEQYREAANGLFGNENICFYRDDGLAIIKSKSARLLDKTRKELHRIFEQFDLKITAEGNLNIVNFLDVTFDLNNAKHKPYRKPNDDPLYINRHSNHPPSITRQLPTAINKSIALLSSDEQTFKESTPIYQNALRHSNR